MMRKVSMSAGYRSRGFVSCYKERVRHAGEAFIGTVGRILLFSRTVCDIVRLKSWHLVCMSLTVSINHATCVLRNVHSQNAHSSFAYVTLRPAVTYVTASKSPISPPFTATLGHIYIDVGQTGDDEQVSMHSTALRCILTSPGEPYSRGQLLRDGKSIFILHRTRSSA